MKIRHALAGVLAAAAVTGAVAAPAAMAATPTAAVPANVYNEITPANVYNEAAPHNVYNEAVPAQVQSQANPASVSCNSTRVCFYAADGDIKDLVPSAQFLPCSLGYSPWTGIAKAWDRSNVSLNVVLAKSDGTLVPISRLDPGETIVYTPSAIYGFCIAGE